MQVTDPCTVRRPNTFLVTVMSTARNVITTVHHDHQREHQDAAIHIQLPQTADECNLIVNINAGNSAGMSPSTEIYIGKLITMTWCCSYKHLFFTKTIQE